MSEPGDFPGIEKTRVDELERQLSTLTSKELTAVLAAATTELGLRYGLCKTCAMDLSADIGEGVVPLINPAIAKCEQTNEGDPQ